MKVDILTREYPPYVYGGAGVHAEELSKVLAERVDVTGYHLRGVGRPPPRSRCTRHPRRWLGEGQPEGRGLRNAL